MFNWDENVLMDMLLVEDVQLYMSVWWIFGLVISPVTSLKSLISENHFVGLTLDLKRSQPVLHLTSGGDVDPAIFDVGVCLSSGIAWLASFPDDDWNCDSHYDHEASRRLKWTFLYNLKCTRFTHSY